MPNFEQTDYGKCYRVLQQECNDKNIEALNTIISDISHKDCTEALAIIDKLQSNIPKHNAYVNDWQSKLSDLRLIHTDPLNWLRDNLEAVFPDTNDSSKINKYLSQINKHQFSIVAYNDLANFISTQLTKTSSQSNNLTLLSNYIIAIPKEAQQYKNILHQAINFINTIDFSRNESVDERIKHTLKNIIGTHDQDTTDVIINSLERIILMVKPQLIVKPQQEKFLDLCEELKTLCVQSGSDSSTITNRSAVITNEDEDENLKSCKLINIIDLVSQFLCSGWTGDVEGSNETIVHDTFTRDPREVKNAYTTGDTAQDIVHLEETAGNSTAKNIAGFVGQFYAIKDVIQHTLQFSTFKSERNASVAKPIELPSRSQSNRY